VFEIGALWPGVEWAEKIPAPLCGACHTQNHNTLPSIGNCWRRVCHNTEI
jgi:hypothetical protein